MDCLPSLLAEARSTTHPYSPPSTTSRGILSIWGLSQDVVWLCRAVYNSFTKHAVPRSASWPRVRLFPLFLTQGQKAGHNTVCLANEFYLGGELDLNEDPPEPPRGSPRSFLVPLTVCVRSNVFSIGISQSHISQRTDCGAGSKDPADEPDMSLSSVAQSCPTLHPMDCSPPGSSVHGNLQARTLEWVAISFSSAGK